MAALGKELSTRAAQIPSSQPKPDGFSLQCDITAQTKSVDFVAMKLNKVNFWVAEKWCLFVIASRQKLFLSYFNNKNPGNVN